MTVSTSVPFASDPVATSRIRDYASLARIAAAVPFAVPTLLLATEADAAIYSSTGLNLTIGFGGTDTTLTITGAGGANVGVINLRSSGNSSYAAIVGGNFTWKAMTQNTAAGNWFGGLPVRAGATWSNPGRTAGEFPGTSVNIQTTLAFGDINFGITTAGGSADDPQRVGNTGATWHLLFKFKAGTASGNYGWLSFTANVNGGPNPGAQSSITITGWGWDDSGSTIGAGVTAVPGGAGLAGLALGAAALRGRRRGRA